MRYVVKMTDGLRVMNTIPIAVRYKGKEYTNVYVKDRKLMAGNVDSNETLTIEFPCEFCHDIKDSMVPGAEIVWPDPMTEIMKWVDAEKYISHVEVEHADIPTDREYRNAWDHDGQSFTHDMTKAREIHKSKLRELRAPLLDSLDVQFMKALETGAPTQTLVAKKQRLRDVTADPRIAAATTIDELRIVGLDTLKA